MDRGDIFEQHELDNFIDINTIPFEKLMEVIVNFSLDELLVKGNLFKLNIDNKAETIIRNYLLTGKAFLEKSITKEELYNERISAWGNYKGLHDMSASNTMLRIAVCCLYDEEAAEFNVYGPEAIFETVFSLLLDLGSGFCKQFRCYIQNNLVL